MYLTDSLLTTLFPLAQDNACSDHFEYPGLIQNEYLTDATAEKYPLLPDLLTLQDATSSDDLDLAETNSEDVEALSPITPLSPLNPVLAVSVSDESLLDFHTHYLKEKLFTTDNDVFNGAIVESPFILPSSPQDYYHMNYASEMYTNEPLTYLCEDLIHTEQSNINDAKETSHVIAPSDMINPRHHSLDLNMNACLPQVHRNKRIHERKSGSIVDDSKATNGIQYETSFVNSNISSNYRNPVLDGLLKPENNEIFDPTKFKDNINLKMKLGDEYETIIRNFQRNGNNNIEPKDSFLNINTKPKRRNKMLEQRCTGHPPIMDIKESIELATRAIEKYSTVADSPQPEERARVFPLLINKIKEHNLTEEQIKLVKIEKNDSFCCKCKSKISDYWQYIEHWDSHRPKIRRDYYCVVTNCPMSVIGFLQKSGLIHHAYDCHFKRGHIIDKFKEWEGELRKLLYTCEYQSCHKAFYRRDTLTRHQKLLHNKPNRVGKRKKS